MYAHQLVVAHLNPGSRTGLRVRNDLESFGFEKVRDRARRASFVNDGTEGRGREEE